MLAKDFPDESFKSLEGIIAKAIEHNFDGIVACNTTIQPNRENMGSKPLPEGGVSGMPIERRSNEVIKFISKLTDSKLPIIGVGGIHDYESAQRKLDAGANLLQIYTSFVYNGPLWPSRLAKRIPLAKAW